jgi:hypothetical protein
VSWGEVKLSPLGTSATDFFLIRIVGVEFKLDLLGTSAIYWPIVPAPGDCEDGEFGGMKINIGH